MNKIKRQEFTLASVTDLTSSSSLSSSPVAVTFSCVDDEVKQLRFQESESADGFSFDLSSAQVAVTIRLHLSFFLKFSMLN